MIMIILTILLVPVGFWSFPWVQGGTLVSDANFKPFRVKTGGMKPHPATSKAFGNVSDSQRTHRFTVNVATRFGRERILTPATRYNVCPRNEGFVREEPRRCSFGSEHYRLT